MGKSLGKIVKSNSHTDYVCQVFGKNETDDVPEVEHYALGTFVRIEVGAGSKSGELVGLIYDTVLLNPDFGRLGPRLSPESELAVFTPDYLNERATLVGITAIGRIDSKGGVVQGVPRLAANSDAQVVQMDHDEIRAFHVYGNDLHLDYLPLLVKKQQENPLALHLARIVLQSLEELLPEYAKQLAVLNDDLVWRAQIGPLGGM
ncbi:MAG: hypothetical protein Kow0077_07500 [Anaerolineae bacterium]